MKTTPAVGTPLNRIEGKQKVTGTARYAADYHVPDLLHGYVVNSPITKGRIVQVDTIPALAVEGVVEVLTHKNRPGLAWFDVQYTDMDAPPGNVFKPLHNADILYNGQPVALVVATSFETARYAATLIRFVWEEEPFDTCLQNHPEKARPAKKGFATALRPPPPNLPATLRQRLPMRLLR